jgi:thioredoxin 1
MQTAYSTAPPTRTEVDQWRGPAVLEFGTDWCGHCRAARTLVDPLLPAHPQVHYLRVEDGKGRPLGRSFGVTLWPTLVFLRDGQEVLRLVRPIDTGTITQAFGRIGSPTLLD